MISKLSQYPINTVYMYVHINWWLWSSMESIQVTRLIDALPRLGRVVRGEHLSLRASSVAAVVEEGIWRQLYTNRSSRKIDSRRLFWLPEDLFSYWESVFPEDIFYTIHPWHVVGAAEEALVAVVADVELPAAVAGAERVPLKHLKMILKPLEWLLLKHSLVQW